MIRDFFNQLLTWRNTVTTQTSSRYMAQSPHAFLHDYDRKQSSRLMRVNHIGEVCAQALYIGQMLTAREEALVNSLETAKNEEIDHLVWCKSALNRLHAKPSLIVPTWFAGAFMLSIIFSIFGDESNAMFLEETEIQVAKHLDGHLLIMPWSDTVSINILKQMLDEELEHADKADAFTQREMHPILKNFMQINSKFMTSLGLYL